MEQRSSAEKKKLFNGGQINLCSVPSWNSSDDMAIGYKLDSRGTGVPFLTGESDLLLLHSIRMALGPTQPPAQRVTWKLSPELKRPEHNGDRPLTSIQCRGYECVQLYLHSSIRLHGVVLNQLSTGITQLLSHFHIVNFIILPYD
jgi:hypothetical protein